MPKFTTDNMNGRGHVSAVAIEKLRELDTCTVSNAIERLGVRLRNEGFISCAVRCQFPQLPPMVGFAATARVRTSSTPMAGTRYYHDRIDFWKYVASLPEPRVLVIEDSDPSPGFGALVGEIHANIGLALKCAGCVTNGSVRDLSQVEALGFPLFAAGAVVSHAYAHIVEFGEPVEIGGQKIHPGDIVHGDRNGVHVVPRESIGEIPAIAEDILKEESELIQFCRSREFSLEELARRLSKISDDGAHSVPPRTV